MQCPGQDSRYWDGEAVFESRCPKCGTVLEFFKDDSKRRCRQCGHEALNPRIDFGCASYCPFAEQCLGSLSPEMLAQKQDLLIERVALAIKNQHGQDLQKIEQATLAARYADTLAKAEEANKAAVVLAAYLAEIDCEQANSGLHETAKAKAILVDLKANADLVTEICTLIAHLGQAPVAEITNNAKVLHDAWSLARITQMAKRQTLSSHVQELASSMMTANGRQEAAKLLA